ncbi:MAG: Fumarylacetoacetate hydrolase family protein [Herbinix sp.]|jgi:2-keto-4-pentenoate hydratase/2-oxohepta-3-ene-1,7-dioic acid hydratase in catechol pathway|nr:Fumarylacetoacetate hydrolase family protein [Herbinix sp.]
MKLLHFKKSNTAFWGIYDDAKALILTNMEETSKLQTFQDVISYFDDEDMKSRLTDAVKREEVKLLPPVLPTKNILCIGKNYADHIKEFNGTDEDIARIRETPIFFTKALSSLITDGDTIMSHTEVTAAIDYEAELAVIIGKKGINISKEEAYEYIYGYSVLNDVSARDLQKNHQQWFKGKSLDTFCPIGPWVVTKDEVPEPQNLKVQSIIDGEVRQSANTNLMIHPINELVEWLSKGMTLNPGDVIATGTPSGVGMAFKPQRLLKSGSTVEIVVEGVGRLKNVVE